MNSRKRTGLLGGSFDPIHYGHLLMAEIARESARLDEVCFIPAATSPLKGHGAVATARQRLEMVRLAISGNEAFLADDIELRREGISYTIDTLIELSRQRPEEDFFLILGADSLEEFGKWKAPHEICRLAIPLVAARSGHSADLDPLKPWVSAARFEQIRAAQFSFPVIEISSRELRRRLANGQSIRYRTPRSVEAYIEHAGLYRPIESAGVRPISPP